MLATGLTMQPSPSTAPAVDPFQFSTRGPTLPPQPQPTGPTPGAGSLGGLVSVKSLGALQAEERAAQAAAEAIRAANEPVVSSLTALIRRHWQQAKQAKEHVERDMLDAVRSRRGEYPPEKLQLIRKQGGSEIYMLLFATKARQLKALLSDVLIASGADKPWTMQPTPQPEIPPHEVDAAMQALQEEVVQAELMGLPLSVQDIRQKMVDAKTKLENMVMQTAREYAARAETTIEDKMVEGGWLESLDAVLDDLCVFKSAFLKGPVLEKCPQLVWMPSPDGAAQPIVSSETKLKWVRVDPFMIYPSPWSTTVNDGYLFERHRLSRSALYALIGVDGYSEDAIRAVLDAHGAGGLHEWLSVDTDRFHAEGRENNPSLHESDLIDALQYWGSVSGKMLREWGMAEVLDDAQEYEVELWLIGSWVIKCVLNPDPLYRRPYYQEAFSRTPGAFWHSSLYDVIKDCQDMCNAAARALANNLGIASGPQVSINVDRMPAGEQVTEMYPWKIWQTTSDPMGASAPAVSFFQPSSNANELMGVYERFAVLADEISGIPRYMAGIGGGEGGAGRTASGMSMMVGNASKLIKSIISGIDIHIIQPSVERCYQWLLQYSPDTDIKGDLKIRARGATSLVTKEQAQVRRNEFLMATANPIDMQIVGLDGRAELLREAARGLNMNPDRIIPPASTLKERQLMQDMAQQRAMENPQQPSGNGQELMDGAPVTDQFSPQPQPQM